MSTMLLTRASIVDLLKHLHPSHFSIGMIYNGYTTCVRKWAMILKAVAKFRHIILYQEHKEKPSSSETGTSEARRSRQRKTIPYQTNLNSISSRTKSNLCRLTEHGRKSFKNRHGSNQSVLGRVRNHQVKIKTYEVGPRIQNEISRHSTSKIRLYEISGHQVALSV